MTETEVAVKLEAHEHEIKSLKHRMDPAGKKRRVAGVFTMAIQGNACGMLGTMMKKRISGTGLMLPGSWLLIPGTSIIAHGITWDQTGLCVNHSWLRIPGRSMLWTLMER